MEEYLQYMRTLRSHMNDVEDQAAKASVEEQMLVTTIQTLEKDLDSAKCKLKQLKEDVEQMMKEKGNICSQILEKQQKIACLESDSSTLAQTLELIQQERVGLAAKITDKSAYYAKTTSDFCSVLQEIKDWFAAHSLKEGTEDHVLVKFDGQKAEAKGEIATVNDLTAKLDYAKAKLHGIERARSELVIENKKMKQSIEEVHRKAKEFKSEALTIDIKSLEDEYQALLSDKSGELEYLKSLQDQIAKMQAISHVIKCGCGVEYGVSMG